MCVWLCCFISIWSQIHCQHQVNKTHWKYLLRFGINPHWLIKSGVNLICVKCFPVFSPNQVANSIKLLCLQNQNTVLRQMHQSHQAKFWAANSTGIILTPQNEHSKPLPNQIVLNFLLFEADAHCVPIFPTNMETHCVQIPGLVCWLRKKIMFY